MDHSMTDEEVMNVLETLYKRYFEEWENPVFVTNLDGKAAWPFPTKDKE
jgi:hypothetical protein